MMGIQTRSAWGQEQRAAAVERWYRAIAETGYVPHPPAEVRRRLGLLVDRVVAATTGEGVDEAQAREIGAELADMHFLQPAVLGHTLEVLCGVLRESPQGMSPRLEEEIIELLSGVTSGYYARATDMILREQEDVRRALVGELGETEAELRRAGTRLEQSVEERTAELVAANAELRHQMGERQRAEKALRESEEKYRDLVENIRDVIYVLDSEGVVTYISPSVVSVLGYEPSEMEGRSFLDFIHQEDLGKGFEGFRSVLEVGSRGDEYRVVSKLGELRCVRSSSRPIEESGRVIGVQGVISDVTDRRQAEDALRASEARWRSLVESAPETIATLDGDQRIAFLNRLPENASISRDGAMGLEMTRYIQEEYRPEFAEAMRSVLEDGNREYLEILFVNEDTEARRWFALTLAPIEGGADSEAAIMVAKDISRRREIDEMKDNLIRDVSHELRTPLAKVQMSLELLAELLEADTLDRARAARIGDLTRVNVQRLLETVEGILDLSQLESGGLAQQREAVDLVELAEEAGRYMESLAQARQLELRLDLPKDLRPVAADRSRIFRVLLNLMDNAIKFSDQGVILITATDNGSEVEVAVRDQGQGIQPRNLERVFERFFQERASYQGVGVGLTICKAIILGHDGRIWAESEGRGRGAVIRFALPVLESALEE